MVELLMIRALVPMPDRVARAIAQLLIKRGVLSQSNQHLDLANKPGTSLRYPEDAARELWRAVCEFAWRSDAFSSNFARLVRGTGVAGSGAGLRSPPRVDLKVASRESADRLARLKWDRDAIVSAAGDDAREEARIIVDYIISLHEAPDSRRDADSKTSKAEAELSDVELAERVQSDPRLTVVSPSRRRAYAAWNVASRALSRSGHADPSVKSVVAWLSKHDDLRALVPKNPSTFAKYVRDARLKLDGPSRGIRPTGVRSSETRKKNKTRPRTADDH